MNRYRDAYIEACYIMMVHNPSYIQMSREFDITKILSYTQGPGWDDLSKLETEFFNKIKFCTN